MRWLAVAALALSVHGASAGDPFYLQETSSVLTFKDTNFKTLDTQTINTSVQNCIWITAGQSNMVSGVPSNFLPVNPNALGNLHPNDGAIYKAEDPLLGANLPSAVAKYAPGFFTATIAGTTMTVTGISSGTIGPGQTIFGPGITRAIITAGAGGTGSYTISVSQTVSSPTAITSTWSGGHAVLRAADAMVTAGKCARVIIEPIAVDGTTAQEWDTGVFNQRIPVAMRRIAQRIGPVKCGDTNVSCAILWGEGESANINETSQAAQTAAYTSLIAKSNAVAVSLGWPTNWGRWLIAKQTYYNNFGTSAAIQAAQAAVVNGTQVFAGANADALLGNICGQAGNVSCRNIGEGSHFSDAGAYSYALDPVNGWNAALHASGTPY